MKFVPKTRLLFWMAVVYFPFTLLMTAIPSASMISIIVIALFVVLAGLDIFLSFSAFKGLEVIVPDIVRSTKGRKAAITVEIRNQTSKIGKLRVGIAFPEHIDTLKNDKITELSASEESLNLEWICMGKKLGRYILDACFLEVSSPFGFWHVRSFRKIHTEIRVYPNLFSYENNLAAILANMMIGIHSRRQIGKGRDFEQLREYLPGDGYEDIEWKATARRGYPISKIYQVERTQTVYLIVDASRLSTRIVPRVIHNASPKTTGFDKKGLDKKEGKSVQPGSNIRETLEKRTQNTLDETILERFITASLVTGMAAEKQGDLFGLITFSDKVNGFIKAKNGKAHYSACRDLLYTLTPQSVSPDFSELFTFIGTNIRKRGLLIFLTSLDDPALFESLKDYVDLVAKQHVVMINMIKPNMANPLFSSDQVSTIDDIYDHLSGHLIWESLWETQKILHRLGIGFSMVDNEKICSQLVSQYLTIKQRQLL